MRETAYAKINLALHVRAREADGYHRIETLFAFAEDGDRLSVAPSHALSIAVIGPFASQLGSGDDNLVLRAARALQSHHGIAEGAALTLDKRLPVASGIGGGSADAAAALRLLDRFWKLPKDKSALTAIARALGADVLACLRSETVLGKGRGDELESAKGIGLAGTPLLLVNPGIAVSTAAVFRGWDGIDRGGLDIEALRSARNDLQAPACTIAPEIEGVLAVLRTAPGARLVRMSGSGATCFASFGSEADRDRAAAAVSASHPHWWQLATRIR